MISQTIELFNEKKNQFSIFYIESASDNNLNTKWVTKKKCDNFATNTGVRKWKKWNKISKKRNHTHKFWFFSSKFFLHIHSNIKKKITFGFCGPSTRKNLKKVYCSDFEKKNFLTLYFEKKNVLTLYFYFRWKVERQKKLSWR